MSSHVSANIMKYIYIYMLQGSEIKGYVAPDAKRMWNALYQVSHHWPRNQQQQEGSMLWNLNLSINKPVNPSNSHPFPVFIHSPGRPGKIQQIGHELPAATSTTSLIGICHLHISWRHCRYVLCFVRPRWVHELLTGQDSGHLRTIQANHKRMQMPNAYKRSKQAVWKAPSKGASNYPERKQASQART